MKENQFSQNYTSYYQLTFSESNSCFSDLSLVIHKLQNSQKHEQYEAEQLNHELHTEMKPSAICLENVTEKETGNAQPGACVEVLSRCQHVMWDTRLTSGLVPGIEPEIK